MIKAVIWDFGGVLTSSPFEAFNAYERERGIPADFIRGINATDPETNAWAQFESSAVSIDEFDGLFAAESKAAGHEIPGKDVIALLSGKLRPRMVRVLERCKENFTVVCITNNVKSGHGPGMARNKDSASEVAQVMQKFDILVESSVEGIRKPNPEIYKIACARADIEPNQAVFLDDLGINLKPAKALGMQTIKVLSEAQAIDELAAVTRLTFD